MDAETRQSNPSPFSQFGDNRILAAIIAAHSVALTAVLMQPAFIHEYVDIKAFSRPHAGVIASIEYLFIAVTMMSSRMLPVRSIKGLFIFSLLIIVCATIASIYADDLRLMMVLRAVAGVGEGLIPICTSAVVARLKNPRRGYAIISGGAQVCNAAFIICFPSIRNFVGDAVVFKAVLLLIVIAIVLLALLPGSLLLERNASGSGISENASKPLSRHEPTVRANIIVLGVALAALQLPNAIVWAFMVWIGSAAGLSDDRAVEAISFALVAAVCGSLLATCRLERMGWRRVMATLIFSYGLGLTVMTTLGHPLAFRLGSWLSMAALFAITPMIQAAVAAEDTSGRSVSTVVGFAMLTAALGPTVGGYFIEGFGIPALGLLVNFASLLAMGMVIVFHRSRNGLESKLRGAS